MKVYLLGTHSQSNTDGKVIITVELLPKHTDMKGITLYYGKRIINPFYRELKLNAGKVIRITDLEEEYDHTSATISVDEKECILEVNKYFYLKSTESTESTESIKPGLNGNGYITVYQYKVAVLEKSNHVARGYTGVVYTHHISGVISTKKYYNSGNLHSIFFYRNDEYNTLEGVRQYRNGVLDCEFTYDPREALIRQRWYDSKGKVYHKVNARPNEEPPLQELAPPPPPPPTPLPPLPPPQTKPKLILTEVNGTESISESEPEPESESEPDDPSSNVSGLGNDAGGVRFKPKEEDSDDDDDDGEVFESSA